MSFLRAFLFCLAVFVSLTVWFLLWSKRATIPLWALSLTEALALTAWAWSMGWFSP